MEENKNVSIAFLTHTFHKLFLQNVKKEFNDMGLNPTYHFVLMTMKDHPNGLTQNEICDNIKLKKPSVSLLLQQLEQDGYITRNPSEEDKRKTVCKLTKKGFELSDKIKEAFDRVDLEVKNSLEAEEMEAIIQSFSKINARLQENVKERGDVNV